MNRHLMNKKWWAPARALIPARALVPAIALVLFGCGADADDSASIEHTPSVPPLSVYAASYPVAYFAERIGGDRVTVELPVPEESDPATWSPDAETVLGYQSADLVLLNGAEYEAWTATASLPVSRVVDSSAGLEDELIVVEDAITHSHGPEGEHSHGETASMTWMDPSLASRQAEAVHDALIAAQPDGEATFRANFDALASDLDALDAALRAAVGATGERAVLTATPDLAYFARRYGLDARTVRFDPTAASSHGFLHDVEHAASHSKLMLWLAAPPAELAERLGSMGIRSVVLESAGAQPVQGDFMAAMRGNVDRLRQAGEGEGGSQ